MKSFICFKDEASVNFNNFMTIYVMHLVKPHKLTHNTKKSLKPARLVFKPYISHLQVVAKKVI